MSSYVTWFKSQAEDTDLVEQWHAAEPNMAQLITLLTLTDPEITVLVFL